jgi:hypothetical protein
VPGKCETTPVFPKEKRKTFLEHCQYVQAAAHSIFTVATSRRHGVTSVLQRGTLEVRKQKNLPKSNQWLMAELGACLLA